MIINAIFGLGYLLNDWKHAKLCKFLRKTNILYILRNYQLNGMEKLYSQYNLVRALSWLRLVKTHFKRIEVDQIGKDLKLSSL